MSWSCELYEELVSVESRQLPEANALIKWPLAAFVFEEGRGICREEAWS